MKNLLIIAFLSLLFLEVYSQEEYVVGASFDNTFKSVVCYDNEGVLSNYLKINDKQFKKVDLITYISFIEGKRSDYKIYNVLNDSITRIFSLYKKDRVGFLVFDRGFYRADIDLSNFKESISKSKEVNYFSKTYTNIEEAKLSIRKFKKEKLVFFDVFPDSKHEYEGSFTIEVPETYTNESDIIRKYKNILLTKYPKNKFDITVNGGGTEVTFFKIKSSKDFFLKFDSYTIIFPFKAYTYTTEIFVKKQ